MCMVFCEFNSFDALALPDLPAALMQKFHEAAGNHTKKSFPQFSRPKKMSKLFMN